MNSDRKTTAAATVAAGAMAVSTISGAFGFQIPPEVTNGVVAIALFIWGLFTNK